MVYMLSNFALLLAAFCVSMYQVGGVVGTILIGYLSDLFLKQVTADHCFRQLKLNISTGQ